MSNKMYDILKWVVMVVSPAFVVLLTTLGDVWGIAHINEICVTITAVTAFVGACLGLSSINYKKTQ